MFGCLRQVKRMKLISPSNKEVDIGETLLADEYIGMTRREVLDTYLRDRALALGATAVNGLVMDITLPTTPDGNTKYLKHQARKSNHAAIARNIQRNN